MGLTSGPEWWYPLCHLEKTGRRTRWIPWQESGSVALNCKPEGAMTA